MGEFASNAKANTGVALGATGLGIAEAVLSFGMFLTFNLKSDARKFRVEGTGFERLSILDENLNVIDALTKDDFVG